MRPPSSRSVIRLDGLPLAIELASPRIKLFIPASPACPIGSTVAGLNGGARDLPGRQQTLRHTIEWSYELLHLEEQRLFRQLSVFVGGCAFQAVEAYRGRGGRTDLVLDTCDLPAGQELAAADGAGGWRAVVDDAGDDP